MLWPVMFAFAYFTYFYPHFSVLIKSYFYCVLHLGQYCILCFAVFVVLLKTVLLQQMMSCVCVTGSDITVRLTTARSIVRWTRWTTGSSSTTQSVGFATTCCNVIGGRSRMRPHGWLTLANRHATRVLLVSTVSVLAVCTDYCTRLTASFPGQPG